MNKPDYRIDYTDTALEVYEMALWKGYKFIKLEKNQNGQIFAITEKNGVLLIDKNGEGHSDAFDLRLLDAFPKSETSIIPFGGIHKKDLINKILNYKNVSAIGVGNFLNYKEHSIQIIKSNMDSKIIRNAKYNNNKYIDLYEIL